MQHTKQFYKRINKFNHCQRQLINSKTSDTCERIQHFINYYLFNTLEKQNDLIIWWYTIESRNGKKKDEILYTIL